jgi:hypothetical protein
MPIMAVLVPVVVVSAALQAAAPLKEVVLFGNLTIADTARDQPVYSKSEKVTTLEAV